MAAEMILRTSEMIVIVALCVISSTIYYRLLSFLVIGMYKIVGLVVKNKLRHILN